MTWSQPRIRYRPFFSAIAALTVAALAPHNAGAEDGIISVSPGFGFTCAVTGAGEALCWGDNAAGQLGDGTKVSHPLPARVSGLSSGIAQISSGAVHACALTTGGAVKCWGRNSIGQLGTGTTVESIVPVDVVGASSGVASLHSTNDGNCVLTSTGGVKCWGENLLGQVGDGTTTDRLFPVDVSGLSTGVSSLDIGNEHACVVTTGGAVKCWGKNDQGQLGDGTTTNQLTPVDVVGLSAGVVSVGAGGGHSCALLATGEVMCWGLNDFGQIGNGSPFGVLTPVKVLGLTSKVAALFTGGENNCVITEFGTVRCWGANTTGQLGIGNKNYTDLPQAVTALGFGTITTIQPAAHTCAILTDGALQCWGSNSFGQLGIETNGADLTLPADVTGYGVTPAPTPTTAPLPPPVEFAPNRPPPPAVLTVASDPVTETGSVTFNAPKQIRRAGQKRTTVTYLFRVFRDSATGGVGARAKRSVVSKTRSRKNSATVSGLPPARYATDYLVLFTDVKGKEIARTKPSSLQSFSIP